MTTTINQPKQARVFPRAGRPSPTVTATVNANCDRIADLRDDESELRKLQAQEVLARRECRCIDARLHSIDCALHAILKRKSAIIDRRREENAELTRSEA